MPKVHPPEPTPKESAPVQKRSQHLRLTAVECIAIGCHKTANRLMRASIVADLAERGITLTTSQKKLLDSVNGQTESPLVIATKLQLEQMMKHPPQHVDFWSAARGTYPINEQATSIPRVIGGPYSAEEWKEIHKKVEEMRNRRPVEPPVDLLYWIICTVFIIANVLLYLNLFRLAVTIL